MGQSRCTTCCPGRGRLWPVFSPHPHHPVSARSALLGKTCLGAELAPVTTCLPSPHCNACCTDRSLFPLCPQSLQGGTGLPPPAPAQHPVPGTRPGVWRVLTEHAGNANERQCGRGRTVSHGCDASRQSPGCRSHRWHRKHSPGKPRLQSPMRPEHWNSEAPRKKAVRHQGQTEPSSNPDSATSYVADI